LSAIELIPATDLISVILTIGLHTFNVFVHVVLPQYGMSYFKST